MFKEMVEGKTLALLVHALEQKSPKIFIPLWDLTSAIASMTFDVVSCHETAKALQKIGFGLVTGVFIYIRRKLSLKILIDFNI